MACVLGAGALDPLRVEQGEVEARVRKGRCTVFDPGQIAPRILIL